MTFLITPTHEGLVRGWRRTRKRGKSHLSIASDPSTATPWLLGMALIGSAGWYFFTSSILNSRHFPEYELTAMAPVAFTTCLLVSALLIQGILEWKGRRFTGLLIILGGVVPLMIGVITIVTELVPASIWLFATSPLMTPFYAAGIAFPADVLPLELARVVPKAFWFWQIVMLLLTGWVLKKLSASRSQIAKDTLD